MLTSQEDNQIMKLAVRIEKRRQAIKFCVVFAAVVVILAGITTVVLERKEAKFAAIQEQVESQEEMITLTDSVIASQKRVIEQQAEIASQLVEHNNVYVEPPKHRVYVQPASKKAVSVKSHKQAKPAKVTKRKVRVPSIHPKVEPQSNSVTFKTVPLSPKHPELVLQAKCVNGSVMVDDKTCYNALNDQFYKAK